VITQEHRTSSASAAHPAEGHVRLSVVIPCLNEEEGIAHVVSLARQTMADAGIAGEVIVADNASEDRSVELAKRAGAIVVHEPRRGYGSAYLAGFAAARGEYIVMGDADGTYDFSEIPRFVDQLDDGADLVMGDRMGNIEPGAMPWLHQHIGNPIMSRAVRSFFRTPVRDSWCGMRGFRRDILPKLDLRATGMEFALEMVIRASKEKLDIRQFPIKLDHRIGQSKLGTFRDGWRGLRFMLVHSPTHLFVIPGAVMAVLGSLISLTVISRVDIFGRTWELHSMIGGALLMIVGTQVLALGLCAHAYGTYFMAERDPWFDRMRARFKLEHGLLLGGGIFSAGAVLGAIIVVQWIDRGLGAISEERLAVLAAALIIIGIQVFFSSFLLSILGLRRRPS
jgi:glycosyltransferase involved in cell wall biosynthesis